MGDCTQVVELTDHYILATATPHEGDPQKFHRLNEKTFEGIRLRVIDDETRFTVTPHDFTGINP
jgi:hypothetical protein